MQTFIAYLIVTIALIYAIWLFTPQGARRWLIGRLIAAAPSSQRARFARLQSGVENAGCHSCKGCETDADAGTKVKTIPLHRR
jgi:hypothetical protein